MAKRSSDPRVDYAVVKVQVRDLVRVVGIVSRFAPRGSVFGKNSFYLAPGGKWSQETCAGCPQQRYAKGKKPGVQDYGGHHVAKRRFEPRVAYLEVKVQVRDQVRVVGIVAPFAPLDCRPDGHTLPP